MSRRKRVFTEDIEVLATLLVVYPQVSRATFDPNKKTLSLVFLCRGPIGRKRRKELQEVYRDSVEVYLSLLGKSYQVIDSSWEHMDKFYSFQVERDVRSLSPGELSLSADLVSDRVSVVSAIDGNTLSEESEFSWSARVVLQEMLEKVKNLASSKKLVALREGEKVLVFDK